MLLRLVSVHKTKELTFLLEIKYQKLLICQEIISYNIFTYYRRGFFYYIIMHVCCWLMWLGRPSRTPLFTSLPGFCPERVGLWWMDMIVLYNGGFLCDFGSFFSSLQSFEFVKEELCPVIYLRFPFNLVT